MIPATPEVSVTEDTLLGGRVTIVQPCTGYRVAIDPVLLAAATPAAPGQRVLDLGCGVGAAFLCLMARVGGLAVHGVELQPALAALARRNAAINGHDRVEVTEVSVAALPRDLRDFDHVISNPPYLEAGRGTAPPDGAKARANMEDGVDLGQWIAAAARCLRPRGGLALIQRADRLADLLTGLGASRMGSIRVIPLWPRAGDKASRVIVTAKKGGKAPLELTAGLVLHETDGRYSRGAADILTGCAHLGG